MTFELTILGCSSAMPVYDRFMSSQILNVNERLFLLDCGEGTQMRLSEYKVSKNKIETILISHLHGDHIYGLPGLIGSMSLAGRKKPLHIYGPIGLEHYLNIVFEISDSYISFDLQIHVVEQDDYYKIFKDKYVTIYAFPLDHRIATVGYKIEEKNKLRNINPEMIPKYNLNYSQIQAAKHGNDIKLTNGNFLDNSEVTFPPKRKRSYACCSDTKYNERIIPFIKDVDLLYHEATYMQVLQSKAKERFHSTTIDAARIARQAEVGKLVLGHYSARYKDLEVLLAEAKTVFPNTELGIDGKKFSVKNTK